MKKIILYISLAVILLSSAIIVTASEAGAVNNPMIWADFPDPDVIRVGDAYYMVSTSMHMSPGCTIMKSTDLKSWEIIGYTYDVLDDTNELAMRGDEAYAGGTWAASLRYNDGMYYVCVMSFTTNDTYIYRTDDIENGKWDVAVFDRVFYDPTLLFTSDDRVFVIYGNGSLNITELNSDLTEVKKDGIDRKLITDVELQAVSGEGTVPEGAHAYEVNGKYYIFVIAWAEHGREAFCFRSDTVDGKYEGRSVLCDSGIAQGGIFDTPNGDWYAVMFGDRGAVGRIPYLIPVKWEDGWPVLGDENGDVPEKIDITLDPDSVSYLVGSDEFDNGEINYYEKRHNMNGYKTPISGMTTEEYKALTEKTVIPCGDFEDKNALSYWKPSGCDTVEVTLSSNCHDGKKSIYISERSTTESTAVSDISGNLKPGLTYEFSVWVKYEEGKDTKTFHVKLDIGGEKFEIGKKLADRGKWCEIKGEFTAPEGVDTEKVLFTIENRHVSNPNKHDDTMDFYIDDAVISLPAAGDFYHDGEYDYNGSNLSLFWQWNHNPDNRAWSLTERAGYLRLHNNRISESFEMARNTLTQRTFGPSCAGAVALETDGMKEGDFAGLGALQSDHAYVGVTVERGNRYIVMYNTVFGSVLEEERIPITETRVYFKVNFVFRYDGKTLDRAYFSYSTDGESWHRIGSTLYMSYSMDHFVGYRFALFSYATEEIGGYADFDWFRVSEMKNESY